MRAFWSFVTRPFRTAFDRRRREREMAEEIAHHLELQIEEYVRAGMAPEDARYAALKLFGHVEGVKETLRDRWSWSWLEALARDCRHGVSSLFRVPGLTVVILITLALGFGLTSAVYSLLKAVLWSPLAVREESSLVVLREYQAKDVERAYGVSYRDFNDIVPRLPGVAKASLFASTQVIFASDSGAVRVPAAIVSAELFETLGVAPRLGRFFRIEEDLPRAAPPVVLSHSAWMTWFGGDRSIVGHLIKIDETDHEVIGVAPEKLFPMEPEPVAFWLTVAANGDPLTPGSANASRGYRPYAGVVVRLAAGHNERQLEADAVHAMTGLLRDNPEQNQDLTWEARSLRKVFVGGVEGRLWLLFCMVAAVLLIACFNVANLLLARFLAKQREAALRLALGAGRWSLMRKGIVESVLLSLAGAALGLWGASWGLVLLINLLPEEIPHLTTISVSGEVALVTMAVALLTGVFLGFVSGSVTLRSDAGSLIKSGGRGMTEGGWPERLRRGLVVIQVATSTVLLVSAGLLLRSLGHLENAAPGFSYENVVTAQLELGGKRYEGDPENPVKINAALETLTRCFKKYPQVEKVAFAQCVPFVGEENNTRFEIRERAQAPGVETSAELRFIYGEYFSLLGMQVRSGRAFSATDDADAARVAVVNEAFVAEYFRGENPLGRHLLLGWGGADAKEIVGVVSDVKHRSLADVARPEIYVPQAQFGNSGLTVLLRVAKGDRSVLAAVSREVHEFDPQLPVTNVRTLEAYRERTLAPSRLVATLITVFAIAAWVLTLVGLMGVMSYHVSRRRKEIGIKMALGSSPEAIAREVTFAGLRLVLAGLVVGLVLTYFTGKLMTTHLFGVSPWDPLTFAAIAGVLLLGGAVSSFVPARRAARLDPNETLRAD